MAEGQEHIQGPDPVITAWQALTAVIAQLNQSFTTQGISSTEQKLTGPLKTLESGLNRLKSTQF